MNIHPELFDFNQTGLLFLLAGLLSVIREKRVIPYLMVAVGSLCHGWPCVLFVLGLLLIDRFYTQRSKWLLLSNAFGFAAMIGASVLSGDYQTVFLVYGLLLVSIHLRQGRLGVVVPLLMVHQFFPNNAPLEVVLPAAGLYLVLEEVLRIAKVKNVDTIMLWAEVPIVLAIFYPFKENLLKLAETPEAVIALSAIIVLNVVIAAVLSAKQYPFQRWVQSGYHRGARIYRMLNRSFSERQAWIQPDKSPTVAADADFVFFFWSAISILVAWAVVIAVVQGRVG